MEWFAPSGGSTTARALVVLSEVRADPTGFVVPALLFYEVHAVLCRKLRTSTEVATALELLWRLGIPVAPFDAKTCAEAADLAFHRGLTGYDATYVATAKAVAGVWLTFDERAHRRIAPLGLSRLL